MIEGFNMNFELDFEGKNFEETFCASKKRLTEAFDEAVDAVGSLNVACLEPEQTARLLDYVWNKQPDYSFQEKVVLSYLIGRTQQVRIYNKGIEDNKEGGKI